MFSFYMKHIVFSTVWVNAASAFQQQRESDLPIKMPGTEGPKYYASEWG